MIARQVLYLVKREAYLAERGWMLDGRCGAVDPSEDTGSEILWIGKDSTQEEVATGKEGGLVEGMGIAASVQRES